LPATLSDREVQVLALFAEGKSAGDVSILLAISTSTVMFHYRRVAERYGTLNRTHTVVEALRRGDLPFESVRKAPGPTADEVFLP
jgi:DNA-binding CsgD family transcriptional regulator